MPTDTPTAPPPSPFSGAEPISPSTTTARLIATLERMASDVTEAHGTPLAVAAKEEFLEATGRVHDGDRIFDQRMAQFAEWFLLDRPLGDPASPTPCAWWLTEEGVTLSPEERSDAIALGTSHRGAFRWVGRAGSEALLCDDLLSGIRWHVCADAPPAGLSLGDVFDARLASVQSEVHFTGAFCYHPPELARPLCRALERLALRAPPVTEVLDTLMHWRLAYDRSEGTPAHHIYRLDDL